MTDVWLVGRKIRLDPTRAIGKGGEADVYDIGGGIALKAYKLPDHPDYRGLPDEQRGARERLRTRQTKLRDFPRVLPDRVVTPLDLATDRAGKTIVGYTMRLVPAAEPLMRYADPAFRQKGILNALVPEIFLDLHQTVAHTHEAGVVIGDFNDLNVLVSGTRAYLIDADSFQFGAYACEVFTERFVDPTLCRADLRPVRPFTPLSDWYAFAVMLMQGLLFVGPYGGVCRGITPSARPLQRMTVFNSNVIYPKPAIPYRVLPDDLLHHFHEVFERDRREVFPRRLLESLRWTRCAACGTEHARSLCPGCAHAAPAAVRETVTVRGQVTATRIFRTSGVILEAGDGRWLVHEEREFRREDGSVVLRGEVRPSMKFRFVGRSTAVGERGRLLLLPESRVLSADEFDANERLYRVENGQLLGDDYIGDVLSGQTRFWVGPEFGFGFYRAGNLNIAFVFDAHRRGINDAVRMPAIAGKLIDAECVFGSGRAWVLLAVESGGKTVHRCVVVRRDGLVESEADAPWLPSIHGACASGNFLLVPTDGGVVRVESDLLRTREFPDTEPFVDAASRLVPGRDGLIVVHRQEIVVLKIGGSP